MARSNSYRSQLNRNYYMGDNLARALEHPEHRKAQQQKRARLAKMKARKAAERKEKVVRTIAAGFAAVLVIGFSLGLLTTISTGNELTSQNNRLENQIEELTVLNDSKEYDIDASVDLDYVIQVATQELGMVRSSASQIITYETQNSEYVQQVAEIPTE